MIGKVWLLFVIDCFDGKVVSWFFSICFDVELVNIMLDNVVEMLNVGEWLVIYSDRGGYYCWSGWLERVNVVGFICLMFCKGCLFDNVVCEGFFGRLKIEMYYGCKWLGIMFEKFM